VNLPILFLKGVGRKISDALGLELMGDKFKALALNYLIFMIYFTLESVFINTLLLRVSGGDIQSVLIYRALTFAFSAVAMNLASAFSRTLDSIRIIRAASALYVLMFVTLLFATESLFLLIYVIGALSGLAGGFYWAGHIVLLTNYTTQQNRAVGIAIITVSQGVMALLMPLVSGAVIGFMPGMVGYRVMFVIAILAVFVQVLSMRKLTPVEAEQKKSDFGRAARLCFGRLILRIMLALEFARGLRDGVFAFFLNIVLFEIVSSESLVGFNSFLAGVASIVAAWLYGKVITVRNRGQVAGLCVTALMLFCAMLLFVLNPLTIILFSLVNTFLAMFINNSAMNNSFDVFGFNDETRSMMTELIGFREIALVAGRVGGIVVVSLFPANLQGYVHAMLTLTAVQYVVALLLYISRRVSDRERTREAGASHG